MWHSAIEPFEGVEDLGEVGRWVQCFSDNTFIRRAAEDAYASLSVPDEAFVYIYRGFEWIVQGTGLSWKELASAIKVSPSHLRDLKKLANYESGIRHASKSGHRVRAIFENYATWACGLLEAISVARQKYDPSFGPMSANDVAAAVWAAAPPPFQ